MVNFIETCSSSVVDFTVQCGELVRKLNLLCALNKGVYSLYCDVQASSSSNFSLLVRFKFKLLCSLEKF